MYIDGIRQSAHITELAAECGTLCPGQRCLATFRFHNNPEYVREGGDMLFRVQRTKGLGKVCVCAVHLSLSLASVCACGCIDCSGGMCVGACA